MKKTFIIDWSLIPIFLFTAVTGIGLHLSAENSAPHGVWHNWAVAHVIGSILMLCFVIIHIKMHWTWFKAILKNGIQGKSKITIAETLIFVLSTITGGSLLLIEGGGSEVGKWHWIIGLALILLSVLHILKRLTPLKKSLSSK
ncbi:MAG: DUF4405 domain-containing protein [Bacteroidales bacterium]|nr:DUF4405 domain-containing protein [Bacteroidales bacterium]